MPEHEAETERVNDVSGSRWLWELMTGQPMPEGPTPMEILQQRIDQRTEVQSANQVPPAIFNDLDGLLRLFVDHAVATAASPQPFLALGAALCAVGAAAGRRYRSETGLRTNIMVIALADSGGGKERPRALLADAFVEANHSCPVNL